MTHVKFVVLAQPRTGSNLLSSYFASHPGVRCIIEPINPSGHDHHMQPVLSRRQPDLLPDDLVQDRIGRALDILFSPDRIPEHLSRNDRIGRTASGFKIMAHQIRALKKEKLFWKYLSDNHVKVVILDRHNVVMQYVSDLIVTQTRQAACWDGKPITSKVEVPLESLEENIRRIMLEKKYLLEKCKFLPYKRLRYEQFKDNCEPVERVLEWLIGEKYSVESHLRKQNPDSLRERVTNYDALVAELNRLGFAHLVDS